MPTTQAGTPPRPSTQALQGQGQDSKHGVGKHFGWVVAASVMLPLFLIGWFPQTMLVRAKDSDIEIKGTTQSNNGHYVFQGHITNTGHCSAPVVQLKAKFTFIPTGSKNRSQDLFGTGVMDSYRNLRPGETREFECSVDEPTRPDGPDLPCYSFDAPEAGAPELAVDCFTDGKPYPTTKPIIVAHVTSDAGN
jgi:uncharacterized protein affecting Mg2+/Co2+ transport